MRLLDDVNRRLRVQVASAFASCDVLRGDPCGYEGLFAAIPFREAEDAGLVCMTVCFNAADEHPNQPFFEIDTAVREASCYEHELDARTAAEKAKAELEAASVGPAGTEDEGWVKGYQAAPLSEMDDNDKRDGKLGG